MAGKSIPVLGMFSPSEAEGGLDLLPEARGEPVEDAAVAHDRVALLLQQRPQLVHDDLGADLRLRLRQERLLMLMLQGWRRRRWWQVTLHLLEVNSIETQLELN